MAVYTLPPAMMGFYKKNINYIAEQSVLPDKRKFINREEGPRHYIDLDHYVQDTVNVHNSVPKLWKDAQAKITEDTLVAYGILPWHTYLTFYKLTKAFENNQTAQILKLSAEIGHYLADAHVPLHTTTNYNGQLTNQHGIHALWESRIPEISSNNYDYYVGRVVYIDQPLTEIWHIILKSHALKDKVLLMEKELRQKFPPDEVFGFEQRGKTTKRTFSEEYALRYEKEMAGMVEKQMKDAIHSIGSFWYTAWVNAGQPGLSINTNN